MLSSNSHSQTDDFQAAENLTGTPSYTLYEPEELGAKGRINDIAIDPLGRLVAASNGNLIVFDGNSWLVYRSSSPDPNDTPVIYSVVLGIDDRLYCSTNTGVHRVSLSADWKYELHEIPLEANIDHYTLHAFRNSFASGRYLYFYGQSDIGRFDTLAQRFEILTQSIGMIIASAAVHDQRLYAFGVDGKVLLHISKRDWINVEGQTNHAFDEGIRTATNWPGKALFAGPDFSGIFRLVDKTLKPWPSEINEMDSHRVLALEPLSQDLIAASIDTKGIFTLDEQGEVVEFLSRELDYRLGKIRKLLHAGNGTVWGIGERYIVRVDFNQPLSDFAIMAPYSVTFPRVFWYKGALHICSDEKIVRAERFKGGALKGYTPLAPHIDGVFNALPVDQGILITSTSGIFLLKDDGTTERAHESSQTTFLKQHPEHTDLVLAAGADQYRVLKLQNGSWKPTGVSAPSPGSTFFGVDDRNGNTWLENGPGKVSRVTFSHDSIDIRTYELGEHFAGTWVNIWQYNERLVFTSGKDNYFVEWNEDTDSFDPIPERALKNIHNKYTGITRPAVDSFGNIWIPAHSIHPVLRKQRDDQYILDTKPLNSIQNDNLMHAIPGEDGIMWFVGESSIFRYDPRKDQSESPLPPTQIHQLELVKSQSISDLASQASLESPIKIKHAENSVRLHFTTSTIHVKETLWHEYRISGYIDEWTAAPSSHSLEFDNLYEGDYLVQVRAVSDNGRYGKEALAQFTILPPLYRSYWAIALYIVGGTLLIAFIAIATRRLSEAKNLHLQQLVKLRTRELGMANDELQQLVSRAESATAAKSSFLANVSHEMRTPLNQILGPAALLLSDEQDPDDKEMLASINHAAERMLQMVEKLTAFSENASGSAQLEANTFDIYSLVDDLYQKYKPEADERRIDLTKHIDLKLGHYWSGDIRRIRQALNILLENAFKFTHSGSIGLEASLSDSSKNYSKVKFEVSDTGIGINAKMRDKIFEPFSQLPSAHKAKNEGTGIGLALCRQTVAALNGEVEVESIEGLGTVFRVIVPLNSKLASQSDETPEKAV
ncbi:ATPase, histidine kinase-, DNA gyrase B-, and HSP90-like domain protein [Verrucomicrobiia bacterium DG1235]|nr:ATPase, histidine kinase-, DNA gyrase B-, and HSP90-like domain protein [Verrucomicrobiae bacterium DG1235]